ncbi:PREDICTED: uncharacterized protein LOC106147278 [Chinchilla lanigera]|uniref:uncharacterized protein LOC106147278 n=1 Tax=Chinchilla lanigera TaxID=34839 RepID=UPI000698AAD1|nr:PREDICTED: uncharacterized protein LOC106147278 [Chinchilla lanigera]
MFQPGDMAAQDHDGAHPPRLPSWPGLLVATGSGLVGPSVTQEGQEQILEPDERSAEPKEGAQPASPPLYLRSKTAPPALCPALLGAPGVKTCCLLVVTPASFPWRPCGACGLRFPSRSHQVAMPGVAGAARGRAGELSDPVLPPVTLGQVAAALTLCPCLLLMLCRRHCVPLTTFCPLVPAPSSGPVVSWTRHPTSVHTVCSWTLFADDHTWSLSWSL